MRVLIVTHPACLEHRPGAMHPERPSRLEAVLAGLRDPGLRVDRVEIEAPRIERTRLELVHTPEYVEALQRFCASGGGALDVDTRVVPESWEAALRACGAGPAAVGHLRDGAAGLAFVAVRPPGHHALPERALGFCLFNNVAVTAATLSQDGERVAVLDWDVHHGNGIQSVFSLRTDVLYVSLHEFPAYPGTGWVEEVGDGPGEGFTLNLPFPSGTAGDVYHEAFERVVVPVIEQFAPDWLLVSAGYDAHASDPLAGLELVDTDYRSMAGALARVAPRGRLVFFLEGGYDLTALEASAAATVMGGVAGSELEPPVTGSASPIGAWRMLDRAASVAGRFWEVR